MEIRYGNLLLCNDSQLISMAFSQAEDNSIDTPQLWPLGGQTLPTSGDSLQFQVSDNTD